MDLMAISLQTIITTAQSKDYIHVLLMKYGLVSYFGGQFYIDLVV